VREGHEQTIDLSGIAVPARIGQGKPAIRRGFVVKAIDVSN
jgi:hypothetical protein